MTTTDLLLRAQDRLLELLAALQLKINEADAELEKHRDFIENAPNITHYEDQIRTAQVLALMSRLEQLGKEVRQADVERRRIEQELILAGYRVKSNDN